MCVIVLLIFPVVLFSESEKSIMFYVEGIIEELQGNSSAYNWYTLAIDEEPGNEELLFEVSSSMINKGFSVEIVDMFAPTIPYIKKIQDKETLLNIARLYIGQNLDTTALKFLERAYEIAPNDVDIMLELARVKGRLGKNKARDKLIKRIENASTNNNPYAFMELGNYYYDKGDYKKALNYYLSAKSSLSYFPLYSFNLIERLVHSAVEIGEYSLAVKNFFEILDAAKDNRISIGEKLYDEIFSILKRGEVRLSYGEVESFLRSFHESYPGREDVFFELISLKIASGEYKDAVDMIEEEIAKGIKNLSLAFYYLSKAYYGLKDTINARWYAQLMVENFPTLADGYISLSDFYAKIELYQRALDIIEQGSSLVRKNREKLDLQRMRILFKAKRYNECARLGESVLKGTPKDIDIMRLLAYTFFQLQDTTKTIAIYDKILKYQKDRAEDLNNFGYFLAYFEKELDRAYSMTKRALEIEPLNPSYMDSYGWALFKLGQVDEAEFYITKALMLEQDDGPIWEHLGDIYFKKGMVEEARALWKKALKLGDIENEQELIKKLQSLE